ncbi:MAG: hypothetical protein ACK5QX_05320 [bacterium]|jgi:hypothetical protein
MKADKVESHGAVAGQVERSVRPRFCSQCTNCGQEPYEKGRNPVRRACAAAADRREAHIQKRGCTPDAYWTAPDAWVYVNSQHAERCGWFVAA